MYIYVCVCIYLNHFSVDLKLTTINQLYFNFFKNLKNILKKFKGQLNKVLPSV